MDLVAKGLASVDREVRELKIEPEPWTWWPRSWRRWTGRLGSWKNEPGHWTLKCRWQDVAIYFR